MDSKVYEIVDRISGLNPSAVLVLPQGFVREEWKSLCFSKGKGLIASSIRSPAQLAGSLVPESVGRILERTARVEMLRANFKQREIKEALPRLLEHRFRPRFFESIDWVLQKGRELFVHSEEAAIFLERLEERNGRDERRTEFFLLNRYWEALLQYREFFDDSRVFEWATERLRTGERAPGVSKIYWLSHFPGKPRERHFLEALSERVEVEHIPSSAFFTTPEPKRMHRVHSHAMEDAAQHLLDRVLDSGLDSSAVVIEDRPEVRRTLDRVARERGIRLLDARDPTLLSHSEELKTALLELDLVARNFPSDRVLEWVNARDPSRGELRKKIIEGNSDQGIAAYRFDPVLYSALEALAKRYPRKMALEELREALDQSVLSFALPAWVSKVVSAQINEWEAGLEQHGSLSRKRPIRFWARELTEGLKQAAPPVPALRNERGLRLYRVDQAVSFLLPEEVAVHFFGVGNSFFEPKPEASGWLSGRDLETLAGEFSLPDRKQLRDTARNSFASWAGRSNADPVFWDYLYDESGAEVESAELVLQTFTSLSPGEEQRAGAHPALLPSLGPDRKPPALRAEVRFAEREFPIGFVNALGNCAFTAYAQFLLKLQDERDPDFELGNDIYGNLLHKAIERMLESKGALTPEGAFDSAWQETRKPAWVRSERLRAATRDKAIRVLELFLESEKEYRKQSGTELRSQEEEIELKREGFVFKGRLDRTDQHADGLVVLDYKTSSSQTPGQRSLETGKGLQLAAYALALQDQTGNPVVSAQYVVLSKDRINRNYGVLFRNWNKGKASDPVEFPVSSVKSNHASLFAAEPETVWRAFDEKVKGLLKKAVEHGFEAKPADESDCGFCRYSGVCGRKRAVLA
ncbi:MAG: PD-(D/E)XK nuclease family protein [Proteobacteria bacterium]|nr:PD-(D/E)XK nuclease family protein [Pseudomonadota bacterium]